MSLSQRFFSEAFRDMQRAMNAFDQPMFNAARRSPGSLFNGNVFRYPASDMAETTDSYELTAELPGYDKKDISIEMPNSRTLVLKGSVNEQHETSPSPTVETPVAEAATDDQAIVKQDQENKQVATQTNEPQYWVKERVSGSFSRSYSFPEPINPDAIKASFENGVLKVTVPKTTKNEAKTINIE